jgi:hypothetical protein
LAKNQKPKALPRTKILTENVLFSDFFNENKNEE